jgi:hypothetical protein
MNGNDKIFLTLILISTLLSGGVVAEKALNTAPAAAAQKKIPAASSEDTPSSRALAIKEKFEKMGLPLHEGKHWRTP